VEHGEHVVSMKFVPQGLILGTFLSVIRNLWFSIYKKDKNEVI